MPDELGSFNELAIQQRRVLRSMVRGRRPPHEPCFAAGNLDGGTAAGMRTVAAKTEDQQAMLGLHRMRSLLIKFRTMQVNQLRGTAADTSFEHHMKINLANRTVSI